MIFSYFGGVSAYGMWGLEPHTSKTAYAGWYPGIQEVVFWHTGTLLASNLKFGVNRTTINYTNIEAQ
jgi:hypothetical protein